MSAPRAPDRDGRRIPMAVARAAAAALAALVLAFGAHAASATDGKAEKDQGLSKEDEACLACHAKPTLQRTLGDGRSLSLHVKARAFEESVHGSTGCDGCHNEIDEKTHGKGEGTPVASQRALAQGLVEGCRDCHKKVSRQYEDSVHSQMLRQGSAEAPLCTDCHDPHLARPAKDAAHAAPVPCRKCHEGIVGAFNDSVHGEQGEALVCADCHRTHDVKAASLGDALKNQCLSCHRETSETHAAWLPNTERHLEAVTCSACHSPAAQRRVNLRLYESGQQATEKVGVPQFVKLASAVDARNEGLDGRALWSLLQEFNREGGEARMTLRGRLEVTSGAEAHRLAGKAQAVKDCNACHRAGAEPFQTVSVTMAGPDGRPIRHEAQAGALTSVESVGAVRGFYAIGSTRIKLLDALLLAALAGGIALPGLHLSVKLLAKRARARQAAAAAAAAASIDESAGDRSPE